MIGFSNLDSLICLCGAQQIRRARLYRRRGRKAGLHGRRPCQSSKRHKNQRRQIRGNKEPHSRQPQGRTCVSFFCRKRIHNRRQHIRRRGGAQGRGRGRFREALPQVFSGRMDTSCRHTRSPSGRRKKFLFKSGRISKNFRCHRHERENERHVDAAIHLKRIVRKMRNHRHDTLRPRRQVPARKPHNPRRP